MKIKYLAIALTTLALSACGGDKSTATDATDDKNNNKNTID